MVVRFDKNTYYYAVTNDKNFNTEFKMLDKAKKELKFHYGNVTREEFNNDYSSRGYGIRKIICIPAALICGLIKTTYHVTQAIFIGIVKAPFDGGKYFLAKTFSVAQDIKQSGGWVATLFNDQFGQFFVEEAAFQKTCYARHLSKDELIETEELSKQRVSFNEIKEAKTNLKAGEIDSALIAVSQWPKSNEKDDYFTQICDAYIQSGEYDKAFIDGRSEFDVMRSIEAKCDYFLRTNQSKYALLIVEKISNKSRKEDLAIHIAEHFLKKGKESEAIAVLRSLNHIWGIDLKGDEKLRRILLGIAIESRRKLELDIAFDALETISTFNKGLKTQEVEQLIILLQRFSDANDVKRFLNSLQLLVQRSFLDHNPIRKTDIKEKCLILPDYVMGWELFSSVTGGVFELIIKDIISEIENNNVIKIKLGDASIILVEKTQDEETIEINSRDYKNDYENKMRSNAQIDSFIGYFFRK